MDNFFKGGNEMWKMPEKKRIQSRIVANVANVDPNMERIF